MTIGDSPHNDGVPPGESATRTAMGTARINDVVGAVQKLRYGQQQVPVTYAPAPGGPAVPKMHWTRSSFAAQPGSEAAYEGLAGVSKALGRVAGTLTFCAQAVNQWDRDAEEFEDDLVARSTRSAYRAGVVTGAGVAGGKVGTAIGTVLATSAASTWSAFLSGAAVGTMAAPGVGTVLCAVAGGIAGGILGATAASKAADWVVDETIDSVSSVPAARRAGRSSSAASAAATS